jgi:hypothetical protein
VPGAVVNPTELLDANLDQLARTSSLVTLRWLETEPTESTHFDPVENPRDRRRRHVQALGDLRAGHPQPP